MKKRILSMLLVTVMAASLTACGEKKSGSSSESKPETSTSVAASVQEEKGLDITTVDYSNPSVVVELDDYEGMDAFTSDVINMRIEEGTVVKITGAVSTTLSTSLMAKKGDGSSVGIVIYVQGDWETPSDGTIVEAVGVIVKGKYAMEVHVLPENITIK